VYVYRAMNDNSSNSSSTSVAHHGLTAEAISRRAYELWEQEGRPESRDLHHWLRAEQQLLAEQGQGGNQANATSSRAANTDTQPLQGTRAAAAASRDTRSSAKRPGSAAPFSAERPSSGRTAAPTGRKA
jgi:hypothetical protein